MSLEFSSLEVTANDFMKLLFASLAKSNKLIINTSDLVKQIYKFKHDEKMIYPDSLFDDIEFRKNSSEVTSSDISTSINALQTFGIIGKLNPSYEKIIIYLTKEDANNILNDYSIEIQKAMDNLSLTI